MQTLRLCPYVEVKKEIKLPVKDNNYKSSVAYEGDCSCGSHYIGETKRNTNVRWNRHNNSTKSSEPWKHLRSSINHYITWTAISNAPKDNKELRKIIYYSLET